MASDGEDVSQVFQQIGDLERDFAAVEIDALRRKEHSLKPLYEKRQTLLRQVPDFWSQTFPDGPEEIQQLFSPRDYAVLASLKSLFVERFQIESETQGEPRSLRFTFEFDDNEHFGNTKLVKEFEYRPAEDGPGNLVSKPVPIKWKGKKKDLTDGLLDAAVELYAAEESIKLKKGNEVLDIVERESLWQHEKLRDKIAKLEESSGEEPSFLNWFGFRGAVAEKPHNKPIQNGGANGTIADDDEEDQDDGMLEVEIFPAGEEMAICIAEDLWPNVMDYFMRSQSEPTPEFDGPEEDDDTDEDESEDDAPELVSTENIESNRPRKRQRTD